VDIFHFSGATVEERLPCWCDIGIFTGFDEMDAAVSFDMFVAIGSD
jgi:hypothetical protein